ncbi:unnamed protein product, partial [Ectocarpus sp. 12 AP-2014]
LFHQNLTAPPTADERREGVHCACREAKNWCSSVGGGIYCSFSLPQQGDQEATDLRNTPLLRHQERNNIQQDRRELQLLYHWWLLLLLASNGSSRCGIVQG